MRESPRSWDISWFKGLFSKPFHEGILNMFSVEMCCIVFPFCTLKEHPQSRQPSPAFRLNMETSLFLDVSFITTI